MTDRIPPLEDFIKYLKEQLIILENYDNRNNP